MIIEYKNYKINVNFSIVSEVNHSILKELYISMFKIFEEFEKPIQPIRVIYLNEKLEKIEYKMQELFGFKINRNYHRYWLQIPTCTCPKLDNKDNYGTQYRIYNIDCPAHGEKVRQIAKRVIK